MEEVKRTELEKKIDILEDDIADISPEILRLLLKDKTTKKNILWCTKDYEAYGYEFNERAEMKVELITGVMSKIIRLMKRGLANQMFLIHQTEHTG